jgi:hypothetical protein
VTGDWRGTGLTGIGVVDPATNAWYLRDTASAGAVTLPAFEFGAPGWRPVTGDWTDRGASGIGVVDPNTGTWYLRKSPNPGGADAGTFAYGAAHWDYVAGHWTHHSAVGAMAQAAAGGAVTADPATGTLTNQELQDTVSAALTRLQDAGVGSAMLARLQSYTYTVGPLSGSLVGYTYARDHTVVFDDNAAGYGWFVDPTPLSDEEFGSDGAGGLTARPGSAAAGHMDLLTVVLHEMGHVAGRGDVNTASHPNNLMDLTLTAGVRRVAALDAVFAGHGRGTG